MTRQRLDPTTIPLFGTQVIEASAGTGKTYTITSLLLRLVTEGELGIEQVLAVTFTNAAAAELAHRIQKRITEVRDALESGEPGTDEVAQHLHRLPGRKVIRRRLDRAAFDVDRAAVTTIHGFCARALAEYALSSMARPDTTLLGDDRGVLYDVVTDFWSRHVAALPMMEFRALGGHQLHPALAQIAKGVISAPGVPLDRPVGDPSPESDALARYADDFASSRVLFAEQGAHLFTAMCSARGLNRARYSIKSIERELARLGSYFQAGELDAGSYPDEKGFFTSRRVADAANKGQPPLVHPLLHILEAHRERALEVKALAKQRREALLRRLAVNIEERMEEEHARLRTQSFDGLLRSLARALEDPTGGARLSAAIRRRFPALLIDEFQDTDPIQYRVFRRIYPEQPAQGAQRTALFFIGDPKQSIYRFRGADVTTYLAAAARPIDAGGPSRVWTLEVNRRSGPSLIAAQNALFGLHSSPFGGSGIRYQPVGVPPEREDVLMGPNGEPLPGLRLVRMGEGDTMDHTAIEVARLLASGSSIAGRSVSPRDVAVLTRTNKQAETVQAALRQLGIPAVMHGDRSVFEAPEAKEIRRILRAWLEPGRRALLGAALCTRIVGRTSLDLWQLGTDAERFEREMEKVRHYAAVWRSRGIAVALETLFAEESLLPRTLADVDGERRMTNIRHLLELLHQAEVERHLGMVGLLRFLEAAIAAPTGHEMAAEARQVRLESDDDAVTLTTVHKSKGLEYGIVFLPQIGKPEWKRSQLPPWARYHDPEREGREFLHIGDDERAHDLSQAEEREEALRLGYVGITRARHQVVAFMEKDRGFSALSWFLHGGLVGPAGLGGSDAWKGLSDEAIDRSYRALVEAVPGALTVESVAGEGTMGPRYVARERPEVTIEAPPPVRTPTTQRRTSSFSAMTRTRAPLSRAEREGKDVDRTKEGVSVAHELQVPAPDTILMDTFPRGARPGDALHAILERLPLAGGSDEERRAIISRELVRRGFQLEHLSVVDGCLAAALDIPLTPDGVTLAQLEPKDCSRELEFSLPVVPGADGRLLSPAAIEACLRSHADLAQGANLSSASVLSADYARAVGRLEFQEFEGFLRGFLDLVFFKNGQMFVVDYKSNHLGSQYEDYQHRHLQLAMESHHYLLQGLLYAVAVHRYAATRIAGYSYQEHFGGVSYLFLRGVRPDQPSADTSVYFFKPSQDLIEALSTLFGSAPSRRGAEA